MQLADLVYDYPIIGEPGFQTKITAKNEFAMLATSPSEAPPLRGTPYKHQSIIIRYMLQYDRLFLIHDAGTGKSCSTVYPAESNLRREVAVSVSDYILDYVQPRKSNINRIYVLTRGPTLRDEFLYQIICRCTTRYDTEALNSISNEAMRERKIHSEVSKYYSVMTYGGLVREVASKRLTEEQIRDQYSNCFFIIDEPQYLADPELGEEKNSYSDLLRIFYIVKNCKFMATTATPMVNDVKEIANMLNLILPEEKALDPRADYTKVTLEELGPILSGYISYVRALDSGLNIVYQGENLQGEEGELQTKVEPSLMGELQYKVYVENSSFTNEGKNSSFYNEERHISNFVYPDGSYGSEGFLRYVDINGPDTFTAKRELSSIARDKKNLANLSGKMATLVDLLLKLPGNHFVYSSYKMGSGADLIAAILKLYGFSQYLETSSAFSDRERETNFCLNAPLNRTERKLRLVPALRFALITPETPNTRRRSLLELFNSYENRHGKYIKVLLAPPVAKAGINLSNVVYVHLFDSDWNAAGNYQAENRAIRNTSHLALLQEAREKAVEEGKDPSKVRVQVNIYRHVALTLNEDVVSIDLAIYERAEVKDREIKRMLRILKQVAVDCHLNRARNIRPGDVEGSVTCDYTTCDYQCYDPAPDYIDYSSFNVLYSRPYVDQIAIAITSIFLETLTISLRELSKVLTEYDPRYIIMAISKLVEEKIPFYNQYGKLSYLREDAGYLYLENEIPTGKGSFPLSFYTENLIAVQHVPLETITTANESDEISSKILRLLQLDPESRTWEQAFNALSTEGLVLLLETAISYTAGILQLPFEVTQETLDKITQEFFSLFYMLNEPVKQIASYKSLMDRTVKKKGRPPNKGNLPKINPAEFTAASLRQNTEVVYIHTVYDINRMGTTGTGKRGKKVTGRIRLLKPSEGAWREVTLIEGKVYAEIFDKYTEELHAPFEVNKIYGILERINNKFRIRDRTTENTKLSKSDLRYIKNGRECSSWNIPTLISIMWQLEIPTPRHRINLSLDRVINALRKKNVFKHVREDTFDKEKAEYFYYWLYLSDKGKVGDMCERIFKVLQRDGKLLVI